MNKILVCNQKMFLSYTDAKKLRDDLKSYNDENIIICPNFLNMDLYKKYNLCAQNCHYEKEGSYTGEVSAYHLGLKKIKYVLLGHPEIRCYEDDKIINKKVLAAETYGLTPILCIGETKIDKELNRTAEVIKRQLTIGLKNVDKTKDLYIAYEPAWIIGKKSSLSLRQIEDTCIYIKKILKLLGIKNYKILYGGSVNDENIKSLISDSIDGYLVGKASTDIKKLSKIIKCIKA